MFFWIMWGQEMKEVVSRCDCGCGGAVQFTIPFNGVDLEVAGIRCYLRMTERFAQQYIERLRNPENIIPLEVSKKIVRKSNIDFKK